MSAERASRINPKMLMLSMMSIRVPVHPTVTRVAASAVTMAMSSPIMPAFAMVSDSAPLEDRLAATVIPNLDALLKNSSTAVPAIPGVGGAVIVFTGLRGVGCENSEACNDGEKCDQLFHGRWNFGVIGGRMMRSHLYDAVRNGLIHDG